jgi:GAF domain-containing protein
MTYSETRQGPPSWYLTNGRSVVGPIDTHLLLRGITHARIPADCMIAEGSSRAWRTLEEVREVSLLERDPAWGSGAAGGWGGIPEAWLRGAPNAGEALFLALHAAVMVTRAAGGLVHRWREPFIGLVTSSVHGAGTDRELGQVIPRHDPALAAARQRRVVIGSPEQGDAERAIARRLASCGATLGAPLRGVAMVPVHDGGSLLGMLELARVDHPFRDGDVGVLQMISNAVCLR